MSTLADRLQRLKASFLERAPAEAVAAIDRSTEALRSSGQLERIPGLGPAKIERFGRDIIELVERHSRSIR